MENRKLVEEDFICLDCDAVTFEDVVKIAGAAFLKKGVVKDTYVDAVIAREKVFPTGLPANGHNIAIPHTDSEHVNHSSVAVVVTQRPIEVSMMGSPEIKLESRLFFPLAMEHPKKQLELLKQLMKFFQDEERLTKIADAVSVREVLEVMNKIQAFVDK